MVNSPLIRSYLWEGVALGGGYLRFINSIMFLPIYPNIAIETFPFSNRKYIHHSVMGMNDVCGYP